MEKTSQGQSRPLWLLPQEIPHPPPLGFNLDTEVCIIGAGMAGLTTAYLLGREGYRVTVLDRGAPGGGESSRTTAHINQAIDNSYAELERIHGPEAAALVADSHTRALERIARIVTEEGIACDFMRVDGFLIPAGPDGAAKVHREFEAARRAGIVSVALESGFPWSATVTGPVLRFPNQAQFNPRKYMAGLANAIVRQGGRIFSGAQVTEVRTGEPHLIATSQGCNVHAPVVVVATNSPIHLHFGVHNKQSSQTTYVIAAAIPPGKVPAGLYWDTAEPYHYVRTYHDGEKEYLIVGGADHRTGHANDASRRYAELETWARAHFPDMGTVEFQWSGEVLEPFDGLAFIGRSPGDVTGIYLATGFSGDGMTYSTISGILLTDLIERRQNPWESLYSPARITFKKSLDLLKTGAESLAHYSEWVTAGTEVARIAAGEGGIVNHMGRKTAVYRDAAGALHFRSPVCRHLGCIVHWNSEEKSWDCPCHGSRYDAYGQVIRGPAYEALAPAAEDLQLAILAEERRKSGQPPHPGSRPER